MWKSKDVYYVSDSTGILVHELGHSLICQFPEINFNEEKFPFIKTIPEAEEVIAHIIKRSGGRRPLVFSTILNPSLRAVLDHPEVEHFEIYGNNLERLENCLEAKALGETGFARHSDDVAMSRRVEAINFSLSHDDGTRVHEYHEAEIILVGVSRAGKTPVSVYLATQMGLRSANFPLTSEYLGMFRLPEAVRSNIDRAVGLTTSAEYLAGAREKRYPGSNYARLTTCRQELQQAESIFGKYQIPVINTGGKSIEETATQATQALGISKRFTMQP